MTLGVFLGNGRGAFKAAAETPLPWAYGNDTLAVGDLDRNGRPDLVVIDFDLAAGSYAMQVLLGTGAGTFRASPRMFLPDQPEDLVVADANRDGKNDVVLTLSGYDRGVPASVNIWPGDGSGGLAPAPVTVPLSDIFGVAPRSATSTLMDTWTSWSRGISISASRLADLTALPTLFTPRCSRTMPTWGRWRSATSM